MKTAIIYDWFDSWGGAERLLLTLHEMYPKADWYTSYIDKNNAQWAHNLKVNTSFIQKLPSFIRNNRKRSLLLYPFAFESMNFDDYDLVISVTSSFAKSIITKPGTFHMCYLLTPTRFLWGNNALYYTKKYPFSQLYIKYLQKWDIAAAQRPDYYITISDAVRKRTKKYYKRDSEVLYPPFNIEYWNKIKHEMRNITSKIHDKYYLVVSRLKPYKHVDLAIQALKGTRLIVVGKGEELGNLTTIADSEKVTFLQGVSDDELAQLYSQAEAIIMPQEEDFGYTALEAQFFGCPVIAYAKGGAAETVSNNKTGIFFDKQTTSSLQKAVEKFEKLAHTLKLTSKKIGPENVKKFGKDGFISTFNKAIQKNI